MARTTKMKERNQRKFLAEFAKCGLIAMAGKRAGISRSTVSDWRKYDPKFVEAFEAAHEEAVEFLENEARNRAMDGSDQLLIFMLKAARPEVYRERYSVDHIGQLNHTHKVDLHAVRADMLNDAEYLEFQRQRALAADSHACLVRANGESRAMENGQASHDPGPSTNGHSNGRH